MSGNTIYCVPYDDYNACAGIVTVTAQFKLTYYSVGHSHSGPGQWTNYYYGEGYYYPRDPYGIAGYTFTGWSGSPIYGTSTGNRYYTANWELTYYDVGYNYNGGSDSGNGTSYTINTPFWVINPSRTGYTFTGWTGSNGGTPQVDVYVSGTEDKSYTANWDVINYNISCDPKGGSVGYVPGSYNIESETIDIPDATKVGYTFEGWTGSNGTTPQKGITIPAGSYGEKNYTAVWKSIPYPFDVNAYLDGSIQGGTLGKATFDVDIHSPYGNNADVHDIQDYYKYHNYDSTYTVNDIVMHSGWKNIGYADYTGTIKGDTKVNLNLERITYTNNIEHYLTGFSSNGTYKLNKTSFNALYDTDYQLSDDRMVKIPNGCEFGKRWTSSSIQSHGPWNNIVCSNVAESGATGKTVTQKPYAMNYNYYYDPITYHITYKMEDEYINPETSGYLSLAVNPNASRTTYNVLNGFTLQNPTRRGYDFKGWYLNGKKITGINEGQTEKFVNADDLYNKLANRFTGDITLVAKWEKHQKKR